MKTQIRNNTHLLKTDLKSINTSKLTKDINCSTNKFYSLWASLIAVVIWALLPVLVKLVVVNEDISSFLAQRFLFSTILFCWLIPKSLNKLRRLQFYKACYFILIISGNYYLQTYALRQVPASWYIIVYALNPILTLLFIRHRFVASTYAGLALALLGIYLFYYERAELISTIKPITLVILLSGMFTWSLYVVLIKELHGVYSDIEIVTLTNLFAFLTSICIWIATGAIISRVNTSQLILTIAIGLIVPVAYFLFSYGLRRFQVFSINIQYLEPIISLYFASLILHENINKIQYFAGIIVLIGTLIGSGIFIKRA